MWNVCLGLQTWCDTLHLVIWASPKRSWQELKGRSMEHRERQRAHSVGSLGTSTAQVSPSGLSTASSNPCYYLGGWVDHNNTPLLIKPWTRGAGKNGSGVRLEHSLEDIKNNTDRFQLDNPPTTVAFYTYSKQKTNSLSTGYWSWCCGFKAGLWQKALNPWLDGRKSPTKCLSMHCFLYVSYCSSQMRRMQLRWNLRNHFKHSEAISNNKPGLTIHTHWQNVENRADSQADFGAKHSAKPHWQTS